MEDVKKNNLEFLKLLSLEFECRFHELSELDEAKRSCRRRLAGHNERRRKISAESNAECSIQKGSGTQMKDSVCGQVDDKGRIQMTIQENAAYKHFQIR